MNMMRNDIRAKTMQVFMGLTALAIFIAAGIGYFSLRFKDSYEKVNKENAGLKGESDKIRNELKGLQNDYKALSQDRDNLLIQTKKLVADKNLLEEQKASLEQAKKQVEALETEKDEYLKKSAGLEQELAAIKTEQARWMQEKAQLQEELTAEKTKSDTQAWMKEKKELEKANKDLSARLVQAEMKTVQKDDSSSRSAQELERIKKENVDLNKRMASLLKDYEALKQESNFLEKRFQESPSKFTELARQNKALIKQTANMHYNLGVFYTKNKQYSRAIAELEKAVELNPQDAHAEFNLGYIYAEHLTNRARAIEHFKKYLNLADSNDKDLDWVKKYVVTWTSYGAKEPMD